MWHLLYRHHFINFLGFRWTFLLLCTLLCLLIVGLITMLGNYGLDIELRKDIRGESVPLFQLKVLGRSCIYFIVGLALILNGIRRLKWPLLAFWLILTLAIFYKTDFKIMSLLSDSATLFYLGDNYALISILAISLSSKRLLAIILPVSILGLTTIQSRGSLLGFLAVAPFMVVISSFSQWVKVSALIAAALILTHYCVNEKAFTSSKVLKMLNVEKTGNNGHNLLMDKSFSERKEVFMEQLNRIDVWWFRGEYAGQVRQYRELGCYMHNWLSFWQQYGLIPFLLFVGLYLGQYAVVLCGYFSDAKCNFIMEIRKTKARFRFGHKKRRTKYYDRLRVDNRVLLATFLLATFNLIEAVFARSYATPYIWLSMGMMPAYLLMRAKRR